MRLSRDTTSAFNAQAVLPQVHSMPALKSLLPTLLGITHIAYTHNCNSFAASPR